MSPLFGGPRRVLISAYSCSPGRTSEPGIGWNVASEVAKHHHVWLLTSAEFKAAIQAELTEHPIPSMRVVFVDWRGALIWRKLTRIGWELQHYAWQIAAYFKARRLHRSIGFHVVHHVTLGRYWSPSFMAMLPIPFVWGPVGGGESLPKRFRRGLGLKGATIEFLRDCARWIGERDPFVGITARRSALALATTEESRGRIERLGARCLQVVAPVGLSQRDLEQLGRCRSPEEPPVRFISIGRLVHWEGFHLSLQAFARLDAPDTEYWIVGTGGAMGSLKALARDLGLNDRVRFWGTLSRRDTRACLDHAHVLVHPSLHEARGMVCVEAMAAGKPVICLDLGGPALQVTQETGFKVSARDPADAVRKLRQAMNVLASAPELRERMGHAARIRARDFSWRRRGDYLSRSYAQVHEIGQGTEGERVCR
jgi:glycosyltransferase involved in cell wall biosynthesis